MPKTTRIKRKGQGVSKQFASITAQAEKQYKRDLIAKWKVLSKIGAYEAKQTIAQVNLTKSRIRAIEKTFKQIQRQGKSVSGRVVRPLTEITTLSKKGNINKRYDTSPFFDFVRTKVKTQVRQGIIPTRKGYIVEKTSKEAKVSINKKGEVIETSKGRKRKLKVYRGEQMAELIRQLDTGETKIKTGELYILKKWGSPDAVIHYDDEIGGVLLGRYWSGFMQEIKGNKLESFLKHTVIEIHSRK